MEYRNHRFSEIINLNRLDNNNLKVKGKLQEIKIILILLEYPKKRW